MSTAAFFIGLLPLLLTGTLEVSALEGQKSLLTRMERLTLGFLLGTTGGMFLLFLLLLTGVPLSRTTILLFLLVKVIWGFGICRFRKGSILKNADARIEKEHLSKRAKIILWIVGVLCTAKVLFLAVTFALTPSYLDDTLSNWNLRAKIFYYEASFTTELPEGTNPELSSYPPAVPLLKAMLTTLAGTWSEPLANSVHFTWYLCVLALLYSALRRWLDVRWSLLGIYLFVGLPLPLLHGTNAYAEIFVAAHVLAVVTMLLAAAFHEEETYLWYAAAFGALLPFTKNEGLLIYGSVSLLLFCWVLIRAPRSTRMKTVMIAALMIGSVLIPWLVFKWSHGLSFGNAKSVSGLSLGFEPMVIVGTYINFFFEGNWLLLFPIFIGLLFLEWRTLLRWPVSLLAVFILLTVGGQIALFLFTSLSVEALKQTGFGRGIVQVSPVIVLLTTLLLYQLVERIQEEA